ncbi:MAG: hypothetical protein ACRDTT_01105 [Pseudonocardiaceae bacterium]
MNCHELQILDKLTRDFAAAGLLRAGSAEAAMVRLLATRRPPTP